MNKVFFFLGFLLLMLVAGCKKDKQNKSNPALVDTAWVLSYIEDPETNAITYFPSDISGRISITFNNSNVVTFTGICNTGTGKYSLSSSDGIVITDLALTKIGCVNVEWEGYTSQNLNHAYKYKINAGNLVIYSNLSYNLHFTK